ncbi:hypothetical protein [Kribbella sp. CA-293567]|uniref:hypothetical protein n=1 Tax=Kribbella sp. CA-293567 TaxID=3002436 RepID=UPI0022DE0D25|nr:hypothetical protein [Kribbella sp. CA-293567]WBQ03015.1 hypothetical protein OX958_23895 [Kribbella sp. CA-293567]
MSYLQELPYHETLVHPRTGEALQAVMIRGDGRPVWPVIGASPDDPSNDDDPDDDPDKDDDPDDDADDPDKDDPDDDDKPLGKAGQKALDAMKAKERAARRELRDWKALGLTPAQVKELQAGKPKTGGKKKDDDADGDAPDVEKIRADAKAEAAAEVLRGRVEDKIEAKARAFADPEDAVSILLRNNDLEDFLDGDKIDTEAIAEALKDLGKKKPHLLAQGKKFKGGGDGGARPPKNERPKSLGEALGRHYSPSK